MEAFVPHISPTIALSVLLGLFDACVYLVLRGVARPHLIAVVPASIIGAWIGQAVGGRVGDPVVIGDFSVVWALVLSWVGIFVVVSLASIMPEREHD